ncbi:type IV secretory system conjugative DNA transfer family protein [Candidatus Nanosynbacter sp. TM7-074]|uniref:Type IV secretory system conjugative DNA transfer family protein n=1 Tax=Candidatus Nanosynbacter sp. TM7-074 TaxID=3158573 RepID=A0AB39JB43_9BACT
MGAGPLIVSFIVIVIIAAGIAVAFLQYRNMLREAKNYERGLKMVPLLIHLPPTSEDVNGSNRDERDLTEEVLSQAQVMYNIISSTATKGFKSKVYGQRHMSFEIVARGGLVHYYAVVPLVLVDVIRQAVAAAYPSARLEEVTDANIFSKVGKMSGTIGGEFTLKKSFVYPISTYQESKRDASRALLNALSSASREDGIGVQFLLRPAYDGWSKASESHIDGMKKNKGKKKGLAGVAPLDIMEALWKPPEGGDKDEAKSPEDKQLTSLEQAEVDAISEKTRYPAYEVLIRVVISSNTAARSQVLLKNIIAAFSLFDSPRNNGFKFSLTRNVEEMTTAYIMRFFPQEARSNILNSVEMATLFHLPGSSAIPTSQVKRQMSKQVDGPTDILDEGLLIGYNEFRGVKKPIRIGTKDRRRHVYIIGQTGVGKSVLQENMAYQDMMDGRGFAFIDPHGDLVESLLGKVPKERVEDIIYFNPSDMANPIGLNMFEFDTPDQKDFLVQEAINMLYGLYDPGHTGIVGPRLEHIFRNCALLLMADPAGGTFIDVPKCLIDPEFVKSKLKYVKDQQVIDFWTKEFPASQRSNEAGEVVSWVVAKFGPFISNDAMRNIIGQTKSGFNLREIMDNNKILLVNLSKGKMGELNSKLLGIIFVMKFQAAAMSRADIPEDQRVDFSLYVDEFQNFATDSFESILSEARKYKLSLIMGNQFMTQLTDKIREAIIGNVGTVISGRIGVTDAELMVKKFQPTFDVDDLAKLPNFQSITSVMINNVPSAPFSMNWIPPMGQANNQLRDALVRLSAAKYGKPRAVVEKEIFDRLRSSQAPKLNSMQGISSAGQKPSAGGSSFLDEWLAKRQQLGGKPAVNPVTKPSGVQISSSAQQVSDSVGSISNTPSVAAPVGNPISLQNKDSEREIATVNTNRLPSTVEPSRPVVKNRLDLRSSDNDDNEVTINLR